MRAPDRPPVGWTMFAFWAGSLVSAACLLAGLVGGLVGQPEFAALLSAAGVVVLIATPAAALVATALELRQRRPAAALLAVIVLGVLALSVVLALATT